MTESLQPTSQETASGRKSTWFWFVPLAIFLAVSGAFFYALRSGDPSTLPSVLIGKAIPEFELPAVAKLKLDGQVIPGFGSKELGQNEATIVNVWASWCGPCTTEHPYLMALKDKSGVPIYGINHKDQPANARRFLRRLGNPYAAVGADTKGRVSIDWGVYGVPETFIVDGQGKIVLKHVGPINQAIVDNKLLPALNAARTP